MKAKVPSCKNRNHEQQIEAESRPGFVSPWSYMTFFVCLFFVFIES